VGKNPFDFANYQIGGAFANEAAEYLDGQPLNIGISTCRLRFHPGFNFGVQGPIQQPGSGVGKFAGA